MRRRTRAARMGKRRVSPPRAAGSPAGRRGEPPRQGRAWSPARRQATTGPSRPEVLAPAGDGESLRAALHCGADAVYFGLQEGFNARARAGNFALADLQEIVRASHAAGARVYLTFNTLIFEPELPFVEEMLRQVHAAGVDAVLVQDPAVALLARRVAPDLALHASTQMTISSPEAALFAKDLGAVRAVLPRELSLQEIRTFLAATDLETEVFVHGALCVAWSGQCLTSEAWGGRSANRGQCAQSCRMPYDLILDGQVRDLGDVKYLLSPKDLTGLSAIPELVRLGVQGLKIEGRQKGPQYVATAVSAYRRFVDAVAHGQDKTPGARAQREKDLRAMSLAYTRGFGPGFLAGSDHQNLVEGRFPKHRGLYVGRVVRVDGRDVVVETDREGRPWTGALALGDRQAGPVGETSSPLGTAGSASSVTSAWAAGSIPPEHLRPGMGIVFDAGLPEDKHEPGGPLFRISSESQGRFILGFGQPGPDLQHVHPGQRVWVTSDPDVVNTTTRLVRSPLAPRRLALDLDVRGAPGTPLHIRAACKGQVVQVTTSTPARPARGGGLTVALLREKLGALGGTPFELRRLEVEGLAPGLQVPVSELKQARRRFVEALEPGCLAAESRRPDTAPRHAASRPHFALPTLAPPDPQPLLVPLCRSPEQLEAVIDAGLGEVELDWMEQVGLSHAVTRARQAGLRVTLATLRVQKPGEEAFDTRLARLEPDGILVRHWGGMVTFARQRAEAPHRFASLRMHGDFSLNVTNSMTAAHLFEWGLDTLTTAHDLDAEQLFALLSHAPPERLAVVVHHRIPTFHTEHCVYSHLLSNGRDHHSCGRPCERHALSLRDHLDRVHPVVVDAGCRNTVFNGEVQSAATLMPALLARGVRRFRVEFVRESQEETAAVLDAYGDLLARRTTPERLLRRIDAIGRQGVSPEAMRLLGPRAR